MSFQVFRHLHRVTYAECTVGNHIYYARYLDLLEAARGEMLRQLQSPVLKWQNEGIIFPVLECQVRYRGAARYDDLLTIETWIRERGRVRATFGYRVLNQDSRLLVEATTTHACTTLDDKVQRLPEDLARLLEPFLEPATK